MSVVLFKCSRYNFIKYFSNAVKCRGVTTSTEIPIVSLVDIKRQLKLHGFTPEDGYTCLVSKCPDCKKKGKEPGNVFLNKITGFFLCSCCEKNGQWATLEKIIKGKTKSLLPGETSVPYHKDYHSRWQQILADSRSIGELSQQEIDNIIINFNLPTVPDSHKHLKDVRIMTDKIVFPLKDLSGGISGAKIISCHRDGIEGALEEVCEGGGGVVHLGGATSGGTKGAVLVPSVGDALAVVSSRYVGPVICPPLGFNSLPQEILPILENFSRLTLWGSSDDWDCLFAVARKLSHSRCFIVRSLQYQGGALSTFKQGVDVRDLLSSARPIWHKSITSFSSLREDVLSELYNIDKVRGVKWKRYPSLNKLLHGHRRGELTILTGPTGSGKTTFCSEYSLDLAMQGITTLWGSFEIRNSRLARTMLQQFAGIPLEENIKEFDRLADDFEKLPIHFLMFHGQQTIKDVMEAVEHAFYIHDIAHVVIDNVQFMLGVGDEASHRVDKYWRQDAVIASFRTFATKRNCHVTLVMHPRKEREAEDLSTNSIFGSAKASQEADNVLIIQDKRLTAVRGKKYLQVAKNRYSGDLGIVPLEFDKAGLSFAQKKKTSKPEENKTSQENE